MPSHTSADSHKDTHKKQATQQPASQEYLPEEQFESAEPTKDVQHAQMNPSSLSPEAILRLQGTVGNRAVQRLLDTTGQNQGMVKSTPNRPLENSDSLVEENERADIFAGLAPSRVTATTQPTVQRAGVNEGQGWPDGVNILTDGILAEMSPEQKLMKLTTNFSNIDFVYGQHKAEIGAIIDSGAGTGDCKTLAMVFVEVAKTYLNINSVAVFGDPDYNNSLILDNSRTVDPNRIPQVDYGDAWTFDNHYYATGPGGPYDPLFAKKVDKTNLKKPDGDAENHPDLQFVTKQKYEGGTEIYGPFFGGTQYATEKTLEQATQEHNDALVISHVKKEKKKRGCYLTTACVEAQGLADDCHELTVLRHFRDTYMRGIPGGEALIEAYYDTAPILLAHLRAEPDASEQLDAMYRRIVGVVETIEAGRNAEALSAYMDIALELKQRYQEYPTDSEAKRRQTDPA